MHFIGCELELQTPDAREEIVRALQRRAEPRLLVLDTCQRLECYGSAEPAVPSARVSRQWQHAEAFERLARIAAGLESRILGELEVLGQVRAAYKDFQSGVSRNSSAVDRIFQDALSLARRARKESGIDANLTSLGGLAARTLLNNVPAHAPVAVVGAGSLAGSIVRYLGKRGSSPVRVASRCPTNALNLAGEIGGFGAGLDELAHIFDGVAGIITATAAPHPVIYAHHLAGARRPLILIDLGVPPDCAAEVQRLDALTYIELSHMESKAQINTDARRQRAETAAQYIRAGALAWASGR